MNWILAHLIGDFLFQNDWMAIGKKRKSWICAIHVGAYMLPFLPLGLAWWQLALIAVQHFAQDRNDFVVWLMKAKGSGQFAMGPCSPWSIIMTDNILHIIWITAVVEVGGKFV